MSDPRKMHPTDPLWLKVAFGELGVRETPGREDTPRIIQYLKTVRGITDLRDEVPWCSAAHNWVYKTCKLPTTDNPLARSWLNWGRKLNKPVRGCTVVSERGSESWMGHVNHFLSYDPNKTDHYLGLGGNQNDGWTIGSFPFQKVLGYRWPLEKENTEVYGEPRGGDIDMTPIPEFTDVDHKVKAEQPWYIKLWLFLDGKKTLIGTSMLALAQVFEDPQVKTLMIAIGSLFTAGGSIHKADKKTKEKTGKGFWQLVIDLLRALINQIKNKRKG